jgi:hypothetical protein
VVGGSPEQPIQVVVVLVHLAGQAAVDASADHLQQAVPGGLGVARVVESVGESPREPDALIELADGEQPGVAGELALGRPDNERRAENVQDLRPDG